MSVGIITKRPIEGRLTSRPDASREGRPIVAEPIGMAVTPITAQAAATAIPDRIMIREAHRINEVFIAGFGLDEKQWPVNRNV